MVREETQVQMQKFWHQSLKTLIWSSCSETSRIARHVLSICPRTFCLDFQGTKLVILLETASYQYKILRGSFWFSKKHQVVISGTVTCSLDILKLLAKIRILLFQLLLFCFISLYSISSITEKTLGKIKYLPSRGGDAGVGLEACSVGNGGGKAGLCPVHTMQEQVLKKRSINKFNIHD